MISDAKKYSNYHIIKYEDLVTNTIETVTKIYNLAELDINKVNKLRLVIRKGERTEAHTGGEAEELAWYTWEEFKDIITPKFDKKQISSLPDSVKSEFLSYAKDSMKYLGYI